MGQDVDRTMFSRRDRQKYRSKVQRCLDALDPDAARAPVRPRRADDRRRGGAEPRRRRELVPALRGPEVLEALAARSSSPSWAAGTWSSTCRPGRCPATSGASSSTSSPTSSASAGARPPTCGARLAVIGILPTIEPQHLVVDALSSEDRYAVLNEQLMTPARRAHPARHRGRRPVRPPLRRARSPVRRLRLDRARGGVHVDAAAPAGAPGRVRRGTGTPRSAWRACSWRWGRTRRSCSVAAVGRDADPAVRAVVRRAHGGAAQPGRAAAGVVRRAVDQLDPRPVRARTAATSPALLPRHRGHRPDGRARRGPGAAAGRAAAAQRHDLALEPAGVRRRRRGAARARGEPGAARRADRRRHGGQRAVLLRAAADAGGGRAAAVELDVVRGGARRTSPPPRGTGIDGPLYWPGVRLDPARRAGAAQAAAAGRRRAARAGGWRRGDRPLPRRSSSGAASPGAPGRRGSSTRWPALERRGADRAAALRGMLARYLEHSEANEPVHTWPVPRG